MFNPFTQTISPNAQSGAYSFQPSQASDVNSGDINTFPDAVVLDDGYYREREANIWTDDTDDYGAYVDPKEAPEYLGNNNRVITQVQGQADTHLFLNPAPGSSDLIAPRDSGGIPATVYTNTHAGPVDGWAMDQYQNIRQGLLQTPPGQGGPVVGGPDQSEALSAAYFQSAFATVSNAAADAAMVNGV